MEEHDLMNSGISHGENSRKIPEIKKIIKDLEKEVELIQSDCIHSEYEIKNSPTQAKSFSLKRVCKNCEKELGYPSQDEIDCWAKI